MSKAIVRCRCGHQVLAKEVLRTDLYERPTGREYVYVKYRCRRCKRMGEAFVAESRWDWSILEPTRNEMNDSERDLFLDKSPITELEVLEFQLELEDLNYIRELGHHHTPSEINKSPKNSGNNSPDNTGNLSNRTHEQRALSEDSLNNSRKRTGADERRRQSASEETRSEDSSSPAS